MSGRSARRGGGGRGGRTRLALLVTLIWVSAAPPHDSTRPARFWAELIGLDDPTTTGARSISESLVDLEKRGFIVLDHAVGGMPPIVQLLKEDLSRNLYSVPGAKKDDEAIEQYFRVPKALWMSGIIQEMSGSALAMYLLVLSQVRSDDVEPKVWFSPATFKERFGLGDSTRKTGLRELVDLGILIEQVESLDNSGGTANRTYRRKTYSLDLRYSL